MTATSKLRRTLRPFRLREADPHAHKSETLYHFGDCHRRRGAAGLPDARVAVPRPVEVSRLPAARVPGLYFEDQAAQAARHDVDQLSVCPGWGNGIDVCRNRPARLRSRPGSMPLEAPEAA